MNTLNLAFEIITRQWIKFAFAALIAACTAPDATKNSSYIPMDNNVWHVELIDANHLVYAAYDGTIGLRNINTGNDEWSFQAGAFVFDLTIGDIDRDGSLETAFVTAQGELGLLDDSGTKRWSFESKLPLFNVSLGNFMGDENLEVACGGIDRKVYVLNAQGNPIAISSEMERLVHRIAAGNLDDDPYDEILVIENRTIANLLDFSDNELISQWRKPLKVPDELINWENPRGSFFAFSVEIADLDLDGTNEILFGDTYFNKQAVMVTDNQAHSKWISEGLAPFQREDKGQLEFYSTTFVRAADVFKEIPGMEVISVAGGMVRIWDQKGTLLGDQNAVIGFTDLEILDNTLYLGSSPNGDDHIYRITLDSTWENQLAALEYKGAMQQVKQNISRVAQQVSDYTGSPLSDKVYQMDFWLGNVPFTDAGALEYQKQEDWFYATFPYPNILLMNRLKVIEPTPPLDESGKPWSPGRWRVDAINGTMTVDEILEKARWIEENEIPTLFYIGHSCMPFITLETAEQILQIAPNYCLGFQTSEDENLNLIPRYFENFYKPLADLCLKYGNKICITKNKGLWWLSSPAHDEVYEAMFAGGRKKVAAAATEDSNSRTPELNLLSRGGLWQAGLLQNNDVSIHGDLFSFNRFQQWEYPKTGHPYLRLLVAHTTLGMTQISSRVREVFELNGEYQFSTIGKESIEIFGHMLGKGLVFSPDRENILGYSPIGMVVHKPSKKWLEDAHNGHTPEKWEEDSELHNAIIPHNGNLWGMTNTPSHALQHVLLNKERQYGYQIPATPYGLVAFVPEQTNLENVANISDWWHTDGIYIWKDENQKFTGTEAAEILKEEFRTAAEYLPFRQTKEAVFMQIIRLTEDSYRLYFVDPGWINPTQHNIEVKIQLEGKYRVKDVLKDQEIPVNESVFSVHVPAGVFCIVDVTKSTL